MPTNEEIIRQVYEAAEASVRDTAKFISLFAEDGYFLDVPSGNRWVGSDVGQPVEALFVAFPDMHRELLQIHAMGDVVVVELRLQGTHKGEFHIAGGVLPATGRTFDAPCCDVFRLKDGKVAEFRCYNDVSTWLDDLGALHDLDAQLLT
ncbi:nuclear transport factor 2 family protein [Sphingobium yanoikuyae]|uniref:nuclear transport factor 2 family protein n=1 Tax=Sphingobium yanoikuyae TaxID=13690 RepID=UPI000262C59B|nr:ester cyclase [Sphingobium yanoikuyae]